MFWLTRKGCSISPHRSARPEALLYLLQPMVPVLDLYLPNVITHTCQTPLESWICESLKHLPQACREYIPYGWHITHHKCSVNFIDDISKKWPCKNIRKIPPQRLLSSVGFRFHLSLKSHLNQCYSTSFNFILEKAEFHAPVLSTLWHSWMVIVDFKYPINEAWDNWLKVDIRYMTSFLLVFSFPSNFHTSSYYF